MLYLDLEDLLGLVRALEAGPVRDVGLLDSAAARPRSTAFGLVVDVAAGAADVEDIAERLRVVPR